jgi:hypothetical protein
MGFLPSAQRLNLIIHLPVRNQDELTSLIDRLSDPTSPDYRHWLTVAEFTARFGRTEQEYQKVADFAEANGFAVTYKSPNRLMLVVRGSVAQIEKAFNVKMRTYQHPTENRIFYSPDREPSFALDVPVSHISGLNNYSYPHPGAGPSPAHNHTGDPQTTGTGSGPGSSFLGSDMRPAYNMGSNTGTGQAVGLAEFSGYTASDVNLYFSSIQQTNIVPIDNIAVDGGSVTGWTNANDEGEVCLDIEQAVSVAPGLAQLRVYIGPTSFGTGVDGYIFSQMATDNIAKQLSNSWWWYPDDPATDDPYFEEMATQGQTFFNISGDDGAYTGDDADDEDYPAEDVHLTVVGGTELTTTSAGGPWQSEVAWNDDGEGSGGGPADDGTTYFAIPSWQIPVINSSNMGSTTLRNSPDVALQADFDNYICYDNGTCATNWGGTSFATPRWAAWLALVNQQVVANGNTAGLGLINPTLYSIGQSSSYNSDFHDITSGNNDSDGQSKFYYAVVDYDLVTGWGSMNGQPLMAALQGPAVTLSPSNLSFGNQPVGTASAPQTVTLTNSGGATLAISSISVTGTNSGDFSQTNTCGSSVAIGASCAISVTFSPTAAGSRSAMVTITDNAGGSPQTVPLTGTGTVPIVTLSTTSLTFGNQNVGTTSAPQDVTLTNTGAAPLTISGISATGDFAQTNTCGTSVAAGASCMINVTFTPTAPGVRTGLVSITDNAQGSPQMIALTGTGTAPAVTLAPTSLTFGNQLLGTTSPAQTVTLSNSGTETLTITSIAISGDFLQTNTCGTTVAIGASCMISVTFTPLVIHQQTGAVTITDNAFGSPQQMVPLTGTGTEVKLSPRSLTFPVQLVGTTSPAKKVTLTNVGSTAFNLIGISITGPDGGDFQQTNTCGSSVGAGESCTISVTFSPTAGGTLTASVSVSDNGGGIPQTVALSGTGTDVKLSASSLNFGNVMVGKISKSQIVVLTNVGSTTLTITSIKTTGADPGDFSVSNTCGRSVAAGAACNIVVHFIPTQTGLRTAAVSITDNGGGSPQKIKLSGTGT